MIKKSYNFHFKQDTLGKSKYYCIQCCDFVRNLINTKSLIVCFQRIVLIVCHRKITIVQTFNCFLLFSCLQLDTMPSKHFQIITIVTLKFLEYYMQNNFFAVSRLIKTISDIKCFIKLKIFIKYYPNDYFVSLHEA